MVAVAVVQVLTPTLTKTLETLEGLVVEEVEELVSPLDLVVLKTLVDMEIVVKEMTYLTKVEKEKLVVMVVKIMVVLVV